MVHSCISIDGQTLCYLLGCARALAGRYVALVDVDQWLHFRAADRQCGLGATLHDADGTVLKVEEAGLADIKHDLVLAVAVGQLSHQVITDAITISPPSPA